jgi:hypothetical protein
LAVIGNGVRMVLLGVVRVAARQSGLNEKTKRSPRWNAAAIVGRRAVRLRLWIIVRSNGARAALRV